MSTLTAEHVTFAYSSGKSVLENINLRVPESDFSVVTGPNGGGKSTLLKLFLGLIKPQRGEVRVFGEPPHTHVSELGYMPQRTDVNTEVPVTALQSVLMGQLSVKHIGRSFTRQEVDAACTALDNVGLCECASTPFSDLSGGQQQRVLLARAIVNHPRMLLLDEPLANIDAQWQDYLFDLLIELQQSMGIILVTHNLAPLLSNADRVLCINRTVEQHQPQEFTRHTH